MVNMREATDDPIHDQRRLRESRATRSVVAGIAFQASYILVQFIVLAILFRHVGEERFGMWITIYGLTMWLNLLPLGVERSMLTWLGRSAFHQPTMVWSVLRVTMSVAAATSATALVLACLIGPLLPWATILNVTGDRAVAQAAPTALAAIVAMVVAVPVSLGGLVLQAYQRGDSRHSLGIVAQLAGILLLLVGVWAQWPLPVLGVVIVSPILIAGLLQWVAVGRLLPPKPADTGVQARRLAAPLLAAGLGLWALHLVLVLVVNSGPLLVAQASGATEVAPYAAVYRLVGPVVVTFMVIGQAYWPAFGEAAIARDHAWVRRALKRSAVLGACFWGAGSIGALTLGRPFVSWWLGPEATPDLGLIMSGLIFALTQGLCYWSTAALSGLGHVRVQWLTAVAALVGFAAAASLLLDVMSGPNVFLLQAAAIGGVALVNGGYLWRVLLSRIDRYN